MGNDNVISINDENNGIYISFNNNTWTITETKTTKFNSKDDIIKYLQNYNCGNIEKLPIFSTDSDQAKLKGE